MCKLHEADSYGEFYTCVSCMKQTAMENFVAAHKGGRGSERGICSER